MGLAGVHARRDSPSRRHESPGRLERRRKSGKVYYSWRPVLRLGGRESLAALRAKLLSRLSDDDDETDTCRPAGARAPPAPPAPPAPSAPPAPQLPFSSSATPAHRRRRGDAAFVSSSTSSPPSSSSSASAAAAAPGGAGASGPSPQFYAAPWWARAPDVVRCRFSPNGCFLAACTSLGGLRVYEVETGSLLCDFPNAHTKGINDIAWHSSSAYIYTASSDASASLFPLHFRPRACAAASAVAAAACASASGAPVASPRAVATFRAAPAGARAVKTALAQVGRAERRVAGGAAGGACAAQSPGATGLYTSFLNSFSLPAPMTSVAAPQDGAACLYTGSYDELLRLWDVRMPQQPLRQVKAHDCAITSLEVTPASPLLLPPFLSSALPATSAAGASLSSACPGIVASASLDGLVRLWEGSSLRLLRTLKGGNSKAVSEGGEKEGEGGASGSRGGIACAHAVWARSGKFLLCSYDGGQGGRILRLSHRAAAKPRPRRPAAGAERHLSGQPNGEGDAAASSEAENHEDAGEEGEEEEEERWWGSAVTMPLDMPVSGTPAWQRHQEEAQRATAEALLRFSRSRGPCVCSGGGGGEEADAAAARVAVASTSTSASASRARSGPRLAFAPVCTPRRLFSPFAALWRDRAFLPGGDGRVWTFRAMNGAPLGPLAAPVDFSCACGGRGGQLCAGGSVCSSVDAHPDWSVGVLATSWTEPDGGIVIWVWAGEEEDEEGEEVVADFGDAEDDAAAAADVRERDAEDAEETLAGQ